MMNNATYPPPAPQYPTNHYLPPPNHYEVAHPVSNGHYPAPTQAPMEQTAPPHAMPPQHRYAQTTAPSATTQAAAPFVAPTHAAPPNQNLPVGTAPDGVSRRLLGSINRSLMDLLQAAHAQRTVMERVLMAVEAQRFGQQFGIGRGGDGRRGNRRYRRGGNAGGGNPGNSGVNGGARSTRFQETKSAAGPVGVVEKPVLGQSADPNVASTSQEVPSDASSTSAVGV